MNESRYSSRQIASAIRLVELGKPIDAICHLGGFPEATLRQWQRKYSRLSVEDLSRLRRLEWEMRTAAPTPPSGGDGYTKLILATARCVRCSPISLRQDEPQWPPPAQSCQECCSHS